MVVQYISDVVSVSSEVAEVRCNVIEVFVFGSCMLAMSKLWSGAPGTNLL